ncbi:hypothetical protein [Pseudoalteromonas ruthenica]|uniref:LRAT domain-containing protein n=1 Tax=Pseudoalteromonas ruthenica TaxID=151081 RepID=A0A0F4PL20_9GAMM|nr:hypothetical protein [Pseudoalteromonas ruthenica]KJY95884.1 hypothetical protein TW76_15150 [Pseudoalteromonas ruthenica]KJZ00228.1 hypothetical protein TW72_05795 [Pseudoalteromonas ruthenica]
MLKVHVWLPHGEMVGHASLSFGTTYVSFWPAEGAGKKDLKVKRRQPGHFMDAIDEDIREEGGRKPHTITLHNVDTQSLAKYVLQLQQEVPQYQLARFNCSHLVADCLKVACGKEPSFKPSAQGYGRLAGTLGRGIWTPHEILRYASELASDKVA